MLAPAFNKKANAIPIIKTVASQKQGVSDVLAAIMQQQSQAQTTDKKYTLLAEKAWQLIQKKRMHDVSKTELRKQIELLSNRAEFNLYRFIAEMQMQ